MLHLIRLHVLEQLWYNLLNLNTSFAEWKEIIFWRMLSHFYVTYAVLFDLQYLSCAPSLMD